MMQTKQLLAPALLVPAILALEVLGGSPAYSPEEGTSLTKRYESKSEITLDDMSMNVNGQDMSEMVGMEMDTSVTTVTAVTDLYAKVEEGRPTKLKRTYDELSSNSHVSTSTQMTGEVDMDVAGSSELEGESVLFKWDDGAYAAEYAEGSDGDADLLEGLDESMDLAGFLPEGQVGEGDEWEVAPNVLRAVFAPGGSTGIKPEDTESMGMGMGGNTPSNFGEFLESWEGSVTAKLSGHREEDGVHVAVIQLEVDASSAADMTDWMQDMVADAEMPEGMEVELSVDSFDLEFSFEGKGELLWNLDTNLPYAFELSGDMEQVIDTSMNINAGGMEQAMEQSMAFSGTQTITMTTGD